MAIALGQHTGSATGITNTTTTPAITTAATGSIFVVMIATDGTVATPTDSKSNAYTAVGAQLTTDTVLKTRMYYKENGVGGASHTFTETATGATIVVLLALEITGGATSGSLDQSNSQSDTTSPFTSPAVTPTLADELLVGFASGEGPTGGTWTYTAGNSFTISDQLSSGDDYFPSAAMTRVVSSIASYNTSVTISVTPTSTANWIATFKAPSTGTTITPGLGSELLTGRANILGFGIGMPDQA